MMRPDASLELYTGACISEMAITTLTGTQMIEKKAASCVHLSRFSCVTLSHTHVWLDC